MQTIPLSKVVVLQNLLFGKVLAIEIINMESKLDICAVGCYIDDMESKLSVSCKYHIGR